MKQSKVFNLSKVANIDSDFGNKSESIASLNLDKYM